TIAPFPSTALFRSQHSFVPVGVPPPAQISPAGAQPPGFPQRPIVSPAMISHTPGPMALLQQSASLRHSSPAGRQPPRYWHERKPLPSSAHAREQHSPEFSHASPAGSHSESTAQRPSLHWPLQQSVPAVQISPSLRQRPPGSHRPSVHREEQQSPFDEHASPHGLHSPASAQAPPSQRLEQQSLSAVHALSATAHAASAHAPATHPSEQQLAATSQAAHTAPQASAETHSSLVGVISHAPLQHSALVAHAAPTPLQTPPPSVGVDPSGRGRAPSALIPASIESVEPSPGPGVIGTVRVVASAGERQHQAHREQAVADHRAHLGSPVRHEDGRWRKR